ncbi:MAG: TrkH family potassium uptake protein [Clostridiaceae bacterium]|nr:TrkH family potassium uptake protein [Clostridiaceae bacterium]
MNFRMIFKTLGFLLIVEAACMLPSVFVSLIYRQDDFSAFIITIVILLAFGVALYSIKPRNLNIYSRDGFAIVSIGWIMVSLFGALPFIFSGAIPSFTDAFFECVSGFSTTGASILNEVESLPKGILFWRSSTHWLGGMGVLVLTLAVLPKAGASTYQIMRAESPGPNPDKLVPKIAQSARILYAIYMALTGITIVMLIVSGMPLFDSFIHGMGAAGTGGFSNMNRSIGEYNNLFSEIVITVAQLVFGVNFTLYYYLLKGNVKSIFKDEEFRFYIGTYVVAVLIITINITGPIFGSAWESLRYATFQASTIMSTTGYSTTDFNLWPTLSKAILVLLMFIGSCAGSTAGGLKCIRIIVLSKTIKREIRKVIHPRSVYAVKSGGKSLDESVLTGVSAFFFTYVAIFTIACIIIAFNGKDLITTFTSVVASISNIGPGLGAVGPYGSYADFSTLSKYVLSFLMLFGRLEIFPMLILFTPSFWSRANI